MPVSGEAGSKRTRGEEVLAERANHAREAASPEGQQQVQPTEVPYNPGKWHATRMRPACDEQVACRTYELESLASRP